MSFRLGQQWGPARVRPCVRACGRASGFTEVTDSKAKFTVGISSFALVRGNDWLNCIPRNVLLLLWGVFEGIQTGGDGWMVGFDVMGRRID